MRSAIIRFVFNLRVHSSWRSHQCGKSLAILAKNKSAKFRIPTYIRPAHRRRPFQLEIAYEAGLQFERLLGFHLNLNHSAG